MTKARVNADNASADIEGVTAGTGLTGGGTSGTVTVTNSMATAIDAKGDLVAGTGADAFARLAVGTNGQVLTADSATATGLKFATPGGGKVLQVVNATYGTATTTTSGTFSDTGLTVTITPTLATSKILAFASIGGVNKFGSTSGTGVNLRLLRDSTALLVFDQQAGLQNVNTDNTVGGCSTTFLDAPATTAATIYKVQIANSGSGSGGAGINRNSASVSTITVLEIGA